MKKLLLPSLISLLLITPTTSGVLFPAKEVYSYVNTETDFGEERTIRQLLLTSNRIELKNKIDTYIYKSSLKTPLKYIANFVWFAQNKVEFIDFQFFNTEVFYGLGGELFPKINKCENLETFSQLNKELLNKQITFIIIPLKQEIQTEYLHKYQQNYALCKTSKENFYAFSDYLKQENVSFVDLYKLYSQENRYYEKGDTHWNSYGLNLALLEVIKNSYGIESIELESLSNIPENNLVLKRLGLISLETEQTQYMIKFIPKNKHRVLLIHDSFFGSDYVKKSYLNNFYDIDLITWDEFEKIENKKGTLENYKQIIIESSIDSLFEYRLGILSGNF